MTLRFLVVEGNVREVRERHGAHYGKMPSESYGSVLQSIEPDSIFDIAFPADEGANIPDSAGLEGYDGIFLTGSALNAYDGTPEILRQVELARAIYRSKTPAFGSCWGLQMAAAAAGGSVIANPEGREIGFARKITRTADGIGHALLDGRPATWDAPAIHLDIVGDLPPDITILASNELTPVQAAEIRHDGGLFWAVQYHPEYGLPELCTILSRYKDRMIAEGFLRTAEDHAAYVADMTLLGNDPSRGDLAWKHGLDGQILDEKLRLTELRNFIDHRVKPTKSARNRA